MAASASLWADGTEVLLPGAEGGAWVRGAVVGGASGGAVAGQELRVRLQDGGEVVSVASASVTAANPAELERTDDLASLPHLGGQQLLRTLGLRFRRGAIYTRCGPSLLALNPWRPLPLYGAEQLQRCRDHAAATAATPPAHIFAVAAAALQLVAAEGSEQTVVVSGESGAGKTETSRRLLQALAACTAAEGGGGGGGGGGALLPLLLQAVGLVANPNPNPNPNPNSGPDPNPNPNHPNPLQAVALVEPFGSAATALNPHSSRFGRLLSLNLAPARSAPPARSASRPAEIGRSASRPAEIGLCAVGGPP